MQQKNFSSPFWYYEAGYSRCNCDSYGFIDWKSELLSTEMPLTLFSESLLEKIQEMQELRDAAKTVVEENKYQSAIILQSSYLTTKPQRISM